MAVLIHGGRTGTYEGLPFIVAFEPKRGPVSRAHGRRIVSGQIALSRQYRDASPLKVRIETHRRYSEQRDDLDEECRLVLRLAGNEAILDVGCGRGVFLRSLRRAGHPGGLVGLDQSPAMIEESKKSGSEDAAAIEWLVSEADNLPFCTDQFDCVIAKHMLYYVANIPATLRELGRVARENGCILVTTNSRRSLPRIRQLHDDMLVALGFPKRKWRDERFSTEDASEILHMAYAEVEEHILTNALVFTTPEPIVAYVATMFPSIGVSEDLALSDRMRMWLLAEAGKRLD